MIIPDTVNSIGLNAFNASYNNGKNNNNKCIINASKIVALNTIWAASYVKFASIYIDDLQCCFQPNKAGFNWGSSSECSNLYVNNVLVEQVDIPYYSESNGIYNFKCLVGISIKSITLAEGYREIRDHCFNGDTKLTFVDLPSTLTYIAPNGDNGWGSVKTLICRAKVPPTVTLQYLKSVQDIYVPIESVNAYILAEGWLKYASKIKPLSEYVES